MIESHHHDVHATVDDVVTIEGDGSILLVRRTEFHTDSDERRPFRYFRKEALGGEASDDGILEGGDGDAQLDLFTGKLPGNLVIDLEATVVSGDPVALTVQSELLPPSQDSPLEYSIYFESSQAVHYSIDIRPFAPELTDPDRFQFNANPAALTERIHRDNTTGQIHLAGSLRVSSVNAPFELTCRHEEELPSTRLLSYYRQKFTQ